MRNHYTELDRSALLVEVSGESGVRLLDVKQVLSLHQSGNYSFAFHIGKDLAVSLFWGGALSLEQVFEFLSTINIF